ncbi:hypothetical protein EJ08DRAFT_653618 [Tothia fuscella]|uniref:Uncharacterized protein n=1 Tax=Tothia fuscella TaxID=1048955 RepID=A0A9P4TST5_9PEZI|nr:hypothetical protein EJ08DRAFT_653618 [Tothia fuscella]
MPATSNKPSRAFDAPLAPKKERKVKTRKSGNLEQTEEPAGLEPDLAPHLQRFIIKVHRRYYDVIPALYVIPGAAAPNEIHWRDFRDFMGHISFSYERPTGSVWRFIPDPQQCDGHRHFLIVHDTHGGNSLVMWNARDIGDRLERHYGWTSDTFVEKQ